MGGAKLIEIAGSPKNPPLKGAAVRSSIWILAGFGASQLIRLLSNFLLARMLFPSAFGLMALVAAFMQGLTMLSDLGIGPSIIRSERGNHPAFLRTAWTIQIGRGIGLCLLTWAIAAPVAAVFAVTDATALQLRTILSAVGCTALINGFTSTSVFTLNRKLAMGRLVGLELVAQALSSILMVAWALQDSSVWALVAGGFAYSIVRVLLSHAINPEGRDALGWDRDAAHELMHFGRWIFASTLVSFAATQMDRPVLARMVPFSQLGVYSIALTFAGMAMEVGNRLTNMIVFPLLSEQQADSQKLVLLCIRARQSLLWLTGAIGAAFAIGSPLFFGLLYDHRYQGVASLSQWLAISVWTWILRATMDRIPLAMGRGRELFFSNLLNCSGLGFGVLGYSLAQLPGFVLGTSLGNILAHVFLTLRLPHERGRMLCQSIVFTLGWLGYSCAAVFGLRFLAEAYGTGRVEAMGEGMSVKTFSGAHLQAVLSLGLAAIPCVLAGLVVRGQLRLRSV